MDKKQFVEDFPDEEVPEEEAPEGEAPEGEMPEGEAPEGEMPEEGMAEGNVPPEGEGDMGEEQPNVSPQEQALYDKFVDNALKVIYAPNAVKKILDGLKATPDFKLNLANQTVLVVSRVEDSAEQNGKQVPGDVILHAGKEIMEELADLALKFRIHDFSDEELEGAAYMAADLYREQRTKQGKLDTQATKDDAAMLVKADKAGMMDEIAPGVSEYAGRFGKKKQPPPEEGEEEMEGLDDEG